MGAGASNNHPNIWGCPSIQEASKHRGHPNVWVHPTIQGGIWGASKDTGSHPNMRGIQTYGASNIQGASKHMGASKCMGAYGHPPSLTKHAFFELWMYRGHPNISCIIHNYICHLEFLPPWISTMLFWFFFNFGYFIHFLLLLWVLHCAFWNCRKHS